MYYTLACILTFAWCHILHVVKFIDSKKRFSFFCILKLVHLIMKCQSNNKLHSFCQGSTMVSIEAFFYIGTKYTVDFDMVISVADNRQ